MIIVKVEVAISDAGIEAKVVVGTSRILNWDVRKGDVRSQSKGERRLARFSEVPRSHVHDAIRSLESLDFFLRHVPIIACLSYHPCGCPKGD